MTNLSIYQNVKISRFDENGTLLSEEVTHNLILSTGLDLFRNHLISSGGALPMNHFKLGTGTTAAASTDTSLQTSAYDVAFTGSTTRTAGVTFTGSLYSTDGIGSTFYEVGIFTSSSEIVGRTLIQPIIKTSSHPTNELISWAFDLTAST